MGPLELPASPPPPPAGYEPIASGSQACEVRLSLFEGPLDLLLHLIRQNELDITDLPMARIAEQYVEYLDLMRELEIDVAAEYLVMAATLAWIKSRLLLPRSEEDQEEEPEDPRAALVARLLEYERFRAAAAALEERPWLGRDVFAVRLPDPPSPGPEEREIEASVVALLEAFRAALREAREAPAPHRVVSEPISVAERMREIAGELARSGALELGVLLREPDTPRPSRAWIVATFLALLEMARLAVVRLYQGVDGEGVPSGPIRIRATGRSLPATLPEPSESAAG